MPPTCQTSLSMTRDQLHHHSYVCQGELTLGVMMSIHQSVEGEACGTSLRDVGIVESVEALTYAIEKVNSNPALLPGIDLGYAILDDCHTHSTTLSQALAFISDRHDSEGQHNYNLQKCCPAVQTSHMAQEPSRCCYSSSCLNHNISLSYEFDRPYYDIVGLIGSDTSPISTTLATLLGPQKIPQISHQSTADTLSNKKKFPYFLRMIPPDHIQV